MSRYVALLRAVNVGGTGKLSMADLRRICTDAGFYLVQTYIASGNVVFASVQTAAGAKSELERRLHGHTGKMIEVFIRTAAEMRAAANPRVTRSAAFVARPTKRYARARASSMSTIRRAWVKASW